MRFRITLAFLVAVAALCATHSPEFTALQRDLGIQAAELARNSAGQDSQPKDVRDYNIGDQHTFWRWNLSVMPPTWIQTQATCRAVGEHCYIFVADNQWNVNMTQADVDSVLVRLEQRTVNDPTRGAIQMDIDLFGPIPDALDNDPKLIVFYSALGSFQGTSFDGYFSPYNQVTEAQAQQMNPPGHSNECEMIYMTCYPLDPIAPIRLSVLAHELQHLIHWGADANEETWLNEGCSELAMVAYGIPDPITGFPSLPDNNLTAWNQTFADYVKVMLFFTYLQEHYDDTGLILDLVADPANGIASLSARIAAHYPQTTFADIFRNWNVANVLDAPAPGDGLFDYDQLDLPPFNMTSLNQNPSLNNQTLQPYACDYLRYDDEPLGIQFVITSNNPIRVSTLEHDMYNYDCDAVTDEGTGTFFELYGPDYYPLENGYTYYVLSNPSPSPVTWSLLTYVSSDDPAVPGAPGISLGVSPNPFRDAAGISFRLPESQIVRLEIFNARGQKVRSLLEWNLPAGDHSASWDGRDGGGERVSPGVYLFRLSAGDSVLTRKVLLR